MIVVAGLYGLLMIVLSAWMIVRPERVAELGVRYCGWRWMHPVEVLVCLGFGASLLLAAERSALPSLFKVFGGLLAIVGAGLLLTPPSLHRRFGIWSIEKFAPYLRLSGVGSLLFGGVLLYAAVA